MSREWDKENMKTLACRVRKEEAEEFRAYAQNLSTSAHALLADYVHSVVATNRNMSASASEVLRSLIAENEALSGRVRALETELAESRALTKRLITRAEHAEKLVHDFVLAK